MLNASCATRLRILPLAALMIIAAASLRGSKAQ